MEYPSKQSRRVVVLLWAPHSTRRWGTMVKAFTTISWPCAGQSPRNHEYNSNSDQGLLMADNKTIHHGIRIRMCNMSKHQTKHHKTETFPHAYRRHRGMTAVWHDLPRPCHRSSTIPGIWQHTHSCRLWLQQVQPSSCPVTKWLTPQELPLFMWHESSHSMECRSKSFQIEIHIPLCGSSRSSVQHWELTKTVTPKL